MRYVIQMEEVIVDDESMETIDVWEHFGETNNIKEAREIANKLVDDIKNHKCMYTAEISDINNSIGVCISQYYSDTGHNYWVQKNGSVPNGIVDVIEIAIISPKEWN